MGSSKAGVDVGGGGATVTDDVGVVGAGVDVGGGASTQSVTDDVGVVTDDVGVVTDDVGGVIDDVGVVGAGVDVGGGVIDDVGGVIDDGGRRLLDGGDVVPAPVHLPNTSALRNETSLPPFPPKAFLVSVLV